MARIDVAESGPEACAALDVLAFSEIGRAMLADQLTDDGYKVLVGSTPRHLILIPDYSHHPHIINAQFNSSATGRYQFIFATWERYRVKLALPDIGPLSQDRAGVGALADCGALDLFRAGRVRDAFIAANQTWASLPGAGAKLPDGTPQHENNADVLVRIYLEALANYRRAPMSFVE